MIGARRMAFPRIEALTFWLLMAAGVDPHVDDLLRRLPDRLDGLRAAQRPGRTPGMDSYIIFFALVGISMTLLGLNMIATIMTMRAPGPDLVAAADLRLGRARDVRADGARRAGADRGARDGRARPHDQHDASSSRRRRQPLPVREPLLVLRAPRGLHPRPARLRRSCSSCCRSSRASRCGATGWPSRACSA